MTRVTAEGWDAGRIAELYRKGRNYLVKGIIGEIPSDAEQPETPPQPIEDTTTVPPDKLGGATETTPLL